MITATLIGLVGCVPSTAAPCAPASAFARATVKVMPLGDSITKGEGSSTGAGYRLPLWERLGEARIDFVGSQAGGAVADPDHEGHSGYMIDQIRAGIDGWLAKARPDVVLLHLGTNDLTRGDKLGAADRLAALVDQIKAVRPGVTVLVQGLIPTTGGLEGDVLTFNAQVRAGRQYRYVEPPDLASDEMADRLHPNDKGYQRLAGAFYNAMGGVGKVPSTPQGACYPSP